MMKVSFDNKQYLKLQGEKILERVAQFDEKLYIEFGGKMFDDYHASRVLKGFEIDSKVRVLLSIKSKVEVLISVSANDIQNSKVRGDLGITYENETLRLVDQFEKIGLRVCGCVITQYNNQPSVEAFKTKLNNLGIKSYIHYPIDGYPHNVDYILSEEGFGKNDYVETTRPIIIVTGPGPGSGKMATCLSQLYQESIRGIKAGYAKYETFPVWNLSIKDPVNLAYEAATADLNDVNMVDYYHYDAYQVPAVNYNRDLEVFPILYRVFEKIYGESPYKSPTDMGVNMVGFCLNDEEKINEACKQEILRRYFNCKLSLRFGKSTEREIEKIESIMSQLNIKAEDRTTVPVALQKEKEKKTPILALELHDGTIITGKQSELLTAASAAILNAIKYLAGIKDKLKLISPNVIEPIRKMKVQALKQPESRLNANDMLTSLSITATTNPIVEEALSYLSQLENTEAHSTVILGFEDTKVLQQLKVRLTVTSLINDKI